MPITETVKSAIRNASAKGFFHLLTANLAIGLLAFGSQLLVIKFLSPSEMADIKTLQSFVGIAAVIAGFGLNTSVLKMCSEQRPDDERSEILRQSLRYTLTPIAIILIAMAAAAMLGLFSPAPSVNRWMFVFMFSVPSTALGSILMAYLQARKRIRLMAVMQTTIRIGGLAVVVLSAYLFGFGGFVVSSTIVAFATLLPLIKIIRVDLTGMVSRLEKKYAETWYYARWSLAGNLVATIISFLDILMLNYFIDDRVGFGYYSIATIFVLGLNQVTTTVQAIATPYFSEYSRDRSKFMQVLGKYQKLLIILALILTVVAVLIVPRLIVMLYGASYAAAGEYFQILAIKYFIWSCYALLGVAILGIGKMRFSFYSVLVSLVVSTGLSYTLINQYGLKGAAYAQVVSYLIILIVIVLMTRVVLRNHFREVESESAVR